MTRLAGEREEFRKFLRNYDRTAEGSGSDKEPPVDKMSRKDLKIQYESGRDRGLSRADAAEDVLVNFEDVRGKTKYGSKAKKYLEKLRGFAREDDNEGTGGDVLQGEPDQQVGVNPIPGTTPGQFGDPTRDTPGMFAGSYFDYLGTGETSDPRQFYMYGFDGPVGMARADRPVRTERYGVPADVPSFLSDGPYPSTYQTESEYQEENRPDLGDVLLDAGKGAAGAFLDNVLENLIRGIGNEILR